LRRGLTPKSQRGTREREKAGPPRIGEHVAGRRTSRRCLGADLVRREWEGQNSGGRPGRAASPPIGGSEVSAPRARRSFPKPPATFVIRRQDLYGSAGSLVCAATEGTRRCQGRPVVWRPAGSQHEGPGHPGTAGAGLMLAIFHDPEKVPSGRRRPPKTDRSANDWAKRGGGRALRRYSGLPFFRVGPAHADRALHRSHSAPPHLPVSDEAVRVSEREARYDGASRGSAPYTPVVRNEPNRHRPPPSWAAAPRPPAGPETRGVGSR